MNSCAPGFVYQNFLSRRQGSEICGCYRSKAYCVLGNVIYIALTLYKTLLVRNGSSVALQMCM